MASVAAGGVLGLTKAVDARLEVTQYDISSEEIPKNFDGYKIIHLSDAHSDTVPGLINVIEKENPDLIVCTGDMTDDVARPDFSELEKILNDLGAEFLHNKRVILKRGNEVISLSGIGDPAVLTGELITEKISKAKEELGSFDGYDILLFHRANLFELLSGYGFNLVLSGHMHGGQIRLPGVGGMVSPKTSVLSDNMLRPKYFAGAYTYADMTMLVSRGLGNPMLLPRIFNRPELISVTLHHKKSLS